jgi:hypothetical protein
MFAFIAAVLFALGFIFRVANVTVPSWLAPSSLLLLGLVFAALHLAGFGTWVSARVRQVPPPPA